MKKILAIAAAGVLISAAFAGCNNKPPFVRLSETIDSIRPEFTRMPESAGITPENVVYDEATNTVKFKYMADSAAFATVRVAGEGIKLGFLMELPDQPYDLGRKLADAQANVLLEFGSAEGKTSYMIETRDIVNAMSVPGQTVE